MPRKDHIHQFVLFKARSKGSRTQIWEKTWRCALPDCSYYAPAELVIGKQSLCNSCGKEFLLDREKALRVKPVCDLCGRSKKAVAAQSAVELMKNLFPEQENTGIGKEPFE